MPNDLGTRVVRAGLATREQIARALAIVSKRGGSMAPALVEAGVPEDALVGFLLAEGFGPLQNAAELTSARREARDRLPPGAAIQWVALPLGWTPAGMVVAMADPSDEHAVAELERIVGEPILPTVARLSELRDALQRHYPDAPFETPSTPPTSEAIPSQTTTGVLVSSRRRSTARSFPRTPSVSNFDSQSPPIPLRHEKPRRQTAEQVRTNSVPSYDRWEFSSTRHSTLPPDPRRRRRSTRPDRPGLVSLLARLARCESRDEAIALACEAAARLGRNAAFLASHRGVLKGRHGSGRDISLAAVRNLWIPLNTEAQVTAVAHAAERYRGPYGTAPADRLLRSALAAEGDSLWVEPVRIGRVTVGLLCLDAPLEGPWVGDDMGAIAHSLAEALMRALKKMR